MNVREQQLNSFNKFREMESCLMDGDNTYVAIYQIKFEDDISESEFLLDDAIIHSHLPSYKMYDIVYLYTGDDKTENLEDIFYRFNEDRPDDFYGYSLSVGDIIVISDKKSIQGYMVDVCGFTEVPTFIDDLMKEYNGYLIKITYSWGDEEPDIICRNKDEAWETAKQMLFNEAYISVSEHEAEIGIGFSKEEDRMYIHYQYDNSYCYYDIVKR